MKISRDKIIKFCEEYLEVSKFQDDCHNGLQIEGADKIEKIVVGVSFSQALIKKAMEKKAQMVIVHHGIFKDKENNLPKLTGIFANRLKMLLANDINLAGFHLPLDAHPVIGNNISLCKLLGVKKVKPFDVGFVGEFAKPIKFIDFVQIVNSKLKTDSFYLNAGPKEIKKIGIISGGASPDYRLAAELGADTFLCGDMHEFLYEQIKEAKINFINAGHYNTEKLGIKNLGQLIAKKFKIEVEFVDIPCEI